MLDTKKASTEEKRKVFYHLLSNTLVTTVMNATVWFAAIFFIYLETKSVFASALLSALYLVLTASSGFWFGNIVDHHKKKIAMALVFTLTTVAGLVATLLALASKYYRILSKRYQEVSIEAGPQPPAALHELT